MNFIINWTELLKFEGLASKSDTIQTNIQINEPKLVYTQEYGLGTSKIIVNYTGSRKKVLGASYFLTHIVVCNRMSDSIFSLKVLLQLHHFLVNPEQKELLCLEIFVISCLCP